MDEAARGRQVPQRRRVKLGTHATLTLALALSDTAKRRVAALVLERPIIGTAGWSIPKDVSGSFPGGGSNLERYARQFVGSEINSTFYRSHRTSTYERWRKSVPDWFRFAVKIPRRISHEKCLVEASNDFDMFLTETSSLGDARGPLLLQLPPSLVFDDLSAPTFFDDVRQRYEGDFVLEARNASWFNPPVDDMLERYRVTRVRADPPRGGTETLSASAGLHYLRLHGSPRVYFSSYEASKLEGIARYALASPGRYWIVFDNTASGAATANALQLKALLAA